MYNFDENKILFYCSKSNINVFKKSELRIEKYFVVLEIGKNSIFLAPDMKKSSYWDPWSSSFPPLKSIDGHETLPNRFVSMRSTQKNCQIENVTHTFWVICT